LETIERDFAPKGVQFFYVYKSLAHPEYNNYVTPYSLEERLMHVREAEKVIGSRFTWICDDMTNDLMDAMGKAPNSEFLINPKGRVVSRRVWSDPVQMRKDLEEVIGPVKNPTKISDLDMPEITPAGKVARGIAPRVEMPGPMRPLIIEPLDAGRYPYYVKLRAEASDDFVGGDADSGKLYLGFHLDPLYHVHWNNDAKPLEYALTVSKGTSVTPLNGKAVDLEEPADADPREFLLDIETGEDRGPIDVQVRYFACDDDNTFCLPVKQSYRVKLERDVNGGSAMGRKEAPEEALTADRMLGMMRMMDKNGDGKLARTEVPGPFRGHFTEWDANGDGFVAGAELEAAAKKLVESM
jgi:hypothetical protein